MSTVIFKLKLFSHGVGVYFSFSYTEVELYAVSIAINSVFPPQSQLVLDSLAGLDNSQYRLPEELKIVLRSDISTYSPRVLRLRPELVPKGR